MYFILVKASPIWRVYIHDPNKEEPSYTDRTIALKIMNKLIEKGKGKVIFKLVKVVDITEIHPKGAE